jgi:hypothetical protein
MGAFLQDANPDQLDRLTFENAPVLGGSRSSITSNSALVFRRVTKKYLGRGPLGKEPVVIISSVIHHNRARREGELVDGRHILHLPVRDEAEAGQIALVVEHQVQIPGTFGALKLAQSDSERHRPITVASKLTSVFLKRNFRLPAPCAANIA